MKYLILLLAVALVSATYDPFYFGGKNEEVVYDYYTDVRTEVYDPQHFASQFILRGHLHIRNDKAGNGSVFWLKDIEIYAYNGNCSYTWETVPHWTPLPKAAEAYLTPFYVGYHETGLAEDIAFQKGTPEWVYNIHKAIATTFQMDWSKVKEKKHKTPYAFEDHEHGIYGNSLVSYEVVPHETYYEITKYVDPRRSQGFPKAVYRNYFPVEVDHENHDDFWRTTVEREYTIDFDGKIEKIVSYSTVSAYPKNNYNAQKIGVKQYFKFEKFIAPSEMAINFADFTVYLPLTFTTPHVTTTSYVPDLSFGFYQFDSEQVKRVYDIFYEAVEYLETQPITTEAPDNRHVKQGQAINRIVAILRYFNIEQYQTVYDLFTGTAERDILARNLFYRVLPKVGTYPAAAFIKKLIVDGKVTGYDAAKLLFTLGTNFRVPSETVLTGLEDMLHWEKQPWEVRSAAILTYGTLVYKTYKLTHTPMVEKYIKLYYTGLSEAKTYEEKLVWLQGLGNIRVGSVYELLRPIVYGEQVLGTPYTRYLRIHAIWQMIYAVRESHHDSFETFWPVFVDEHLTVDLRVAALKGLIVTANFSELKYIFQYLRHHQNFHLINYFYTFVHSLANVEHEILVYSNKTAFAEQVEEFFNHAPTQVNTRAFIHDYYNEEHGLGYFVAGNTIANETTDEINQIFFGVHTQYGDYFFNNFAVYLRFEGIEYPIHELMSNFYSFDSSIWRQQLFKRTGEPIHVELILTFHDQVFFVRYFDESSINQLFTELFKLFNIAKYSFTNVFYGVQEEYYVPTDIGFAAQHYTHVPFVYQFSFLPIHFNVDKSIAKVKFQTYARVWSHGVVGMQLFNPLAYTFQGTRRVYAYDVNVPFNLDITVDFEHNTLRLAHVFQEKELYSTIGAKSHALTQVFTLPDRTYNVLDKSSSQYVVATNPKPEFRGHRDIIDYHSRLFGQFVYVGIYDYEYTPYDFNGHGFPNDLIDYDFLKEFGHGSFTKFLLSFHNWFIRNSFLVQTGNFGLVMKTQPCQKYPVDEWVYVAHVKREHVNDFVAVPDYHYTINSTIATSYNGHAVTEYGWDLGFEHSYGHVFNDVVSHFWRHSAGSNQRAHYYFTREKHYDEETIGGVYNFYYGTNYEKAPVFDQFHLTVETVSQRSREQQADYIHDDTHTYAECQPQYPWLKEYPTTKDCIVAHASLRHKKSFINYVNYKYLPSQYQHILEYFWHYLVTAFHPTYHSTPFSVVGHNSIAVELVYPIASYDSEVYATVTFPGRSYLFNKFPVSKYYWFNPMEYLYIPTYFQFAREFGHYHVCEVHTTEPKVKIPHFHIAKYPTDKWEVYAADHATNYTWAVYAQRQGEHDLAVKFVVGDQWFVVRPVVEEGVKKYGKYRYQFTTSNEGLEYITGVNSHVHGLKVLYARDTVVFIFPEKGVLYTFDGHVVRVVSLSEHSHYTGYCYNH